MKIFATVLTAFMLIGNHPDSTEKSIISQLYVSNYEHILGTSLEFKMMSASEIEVGKAEQAALNEIERLSKIFSA